MRWHLYLAIALYSFILRFFKPDLQRILAAFYFRSTKQRRLTTTDSTVSTTTARDNNKVLNVLRLGPQRLQLSRAVGDTLIKPTLLVMQLKAVLLNSVQVNSKKVIVYRVIPVAIVYRETANRPSSIRRLQYIASIGYNQTYTFNKFQYFLNPPGFNRI